MASNAVSTNTSALKRRREDTAGGSIPTSIFYSDGPLPSATFASGNVSAAPKGVMPDQYGAVLQGIYNDLVAGKHAIPSPNMVASFAEIHLKSLSDYKGAQSSLQRATTTSNGFALSSSGGAPAVLVKSAPGVDDDPQVTEALKAANDSLAAVHNAATKLLSTVYSVQIEHCRQLTNAGACVDRFAADLTVYCQNVVYMSGFEDVNRYETAVAMLKSAFLRELEELAINFTAKLIKTSTWR
ncbi:hypothetical protein B0H14DRAFT_2647187 [Mycena olivaceomarginata]|nr:hypothetical protein B0H14DRAFT_2647187 [Mycena olivaceomarginata]